ncbi:MAG TPA: hypothetical protein VN577_10230 [Terriglobales bacterium]|nr:hypothetical protein [Terriglobales bacterium]
MSGDHQTTRILEEIRRLETRRAEVEAMIKRDRSASQQRQLQQHLATVERTLAALRQQQRSR